MGFFSSIKKLFGFSEEQTTTVEPIQEAQIVEDVVQSPVVKEVEVPVSVPVVEEQIIEKVETVVENTQVNTVGDIKSKSRRQKPTNTDEQTSSKPRKPYRRPRPKKDKPTE